MRYADDDLFGYMIAGASNTDTEEKPDADKSEITGPDEDAAKGAEITFSPEEIKLDKSWTKALKNADDKVASYLVAQLDDEEREALSKLSDVDTLTEDLRQPIADALNKTLEEGKIFDAEHFGKVAKNASEPTLSKKVADSLRVTEPVALKQAKYDVLKARFNSGFVTPASRKVTRRTAPIRMHAPIAFCGIKLAKDFQTFSRHIAATGENSVLNPNAVGIYSGWLKTRVLIEAFRVGKFYIGANMDILEEQTEGHEVQDEPNPYVRENKGVKYIQIPDEERKNRVGTALTSLGDIGNAHGPASGALHDGSMRPKAFIGAVMNCADSPFDNVWDDDNGKPRLNLTRLKFVLRDWEDLFMDKTIYVGISPEMVGEGDIEAFRQTVVESVAQIESTPEQDKFTAFVDTPRRALKEMAKKINI